MESDYERMKIALREVLAEEMGFGRYEIGQKWDGGTVILQPADSSMKSKEIPMDTFFKKVTSVREKLRVLEQKLNNNSTLSLEDRTEYQKLITRIYGSLTTFNILFRNEEDQFQGSSQG